MSLNYEIEVLKILPKSWDIDKNVLKVASIKVNGVTLTKVSVFRNPNTKKLELNTGRWYYSEIKKKWLRVYDVLIEDKVLRDKIIRKIIEENNDK